MEESAALVAWVLPSALARVEAQQYLPIAKPFRVYVCSSQESFNAYMGAPAGASSPALSNRRSARTSLGMWEELEEHLRSPHGPAGTSAPPESRKER